MIRGDVDEDEDNEYEDPDAKLWRMMENAEERYMGLERRARESLKRMHSNSLFLNQLESILILFKTCQVKFLHCVSKSACALLH